MIDQLALFPIFWIGIGLIVAGALLLGLLAPEDPAPGPTQVTERGQYLPMVLGRHRVGSALLWRGERSTVTINSDNVGQVGFTAAKDDSSDLTGVLERGWVGLAVGCASVIQQIYINGSPALRQPLRKEQDTNQKIDFESIDEAGGTNLYAYFGNTPAYETGSEDYKKLMSALGFPEGSPALFPNLIWLHFSKAYLGLSSPRWPQIEADIIVMPNSDQTEVQQFTFALNHPDLAEGVGGVNPAYALWVLLTSDFPYGSGIGKSNVDKTSLDSIGNLLAAENLWINVNTASGEETRKVIQSILQDCGIVMTDVSGKLHFSLKRDGQSAEVVNADSLSPPIEKIVIQTGLESPTRVEFDFKDQTLNYQTNTVVIEADGPDVFNGTKKIRKSTLKYVTDQGSANAVKQRRGQEFLSLEQALSFKLGRDARNLIPGDLVNIADYGNCRVSKVKYDFNGPEVTVEAYRDPWDIDIIGAEDDGGGPTQQPPPCIPDVASPSAPQPILTPNVCDDGSPIPDPGDGRPDSPKIFGRCCQKDGSCTEVTEQECTEILGGRDWTPNETCDNPCEASPTGSCCGFHTPAGITCEDGFFQDDCEKGIEDGVWRGGTVCTDLVDCDIVPDIIGTCCNGLIDECYELSEGQTCAPGYVFDSTNTSCANVCCPVQGTQGACSYCEIINGVSVEKCINVASSAECNFEGAIFNPDAFCCGTDAKTCVDPPKPIDIFNDVYQRFLIAPRLLSGDSFEISPCVMLRSRIDVDHNQCEGFAGNSQTFTAANQVVSWTGSPSYPSGLVTDTSGFSLPIGVPRTLSLIKTGPSFQVYDNGHFSDLENFEGLFSSTDFKEWFTGRQTTMFEGRQSIYSTRSFRATNAQDRRSEMKFMLPGRIGSEYEVNKYSNIGAITRFGIVTSNNAIVARGGITPTFNYGALPSVGVDPLEQPFLASRPGIGTDFLSLQNLDRVRLDENNQVFVNKVDQALPISWASAGNLVSETVRSTSTGANSSRSTADLLPPVSTRGIYMSKETQFFGSVTPEDFVVECMMPAASASNTAFNTPFGTPEVADQLQRMRVVVWMVYLNAGAGTGTLFNTNFASPFRCVALLDKTYQGTGFESHGIGSVKFTSDEIKAAFDIMNTNQSGNFPPRFFDGIPFGTGGITTYVQVTVGGDGQSPSSTVLIGDGTFANLPYNAGVWPGGFSVSSVPVFQYADSSRSETQLRSISSGWDYYLRANYNV